MVIVVGVAQFAGAFRAVDPQVTVGRPLIEGKVYRACDPVVGAEENLRVIRRTEADIRVAAADTVDLHRLAASHPDGIVHTVDQLKAAAVLDIVGAHVIRAGLREKLTHGTADVNDLAEDTAVHQFLYPLHTLVVTVAQGDRNHLALFFCQFLYLIKTFHIDRQRLFYHHVAACPNGHLCLAHVQGWRGADKHCIRLPGKTFFQCGDGLHAGILGRVLRGTLRDGIPDGNVAAAQHGVEHIRMPSSDRADAQHQQFQVFFYHIVKPPSTTRLWPVT